RKLASGDRSPKAEARRTDSELNSRVVSELRRRLRGKHVRLFRCPNECERSERILCNRPQLSGSKCPTESRQRSEPAGPPAARGGARRGSRTRLRSVA